MKLAFTSSNRLCGIDKRIHADDILRKMLEVCELYEWVSVADLKEICGIDDVDYHDNQRVWRTANIQGANIVHGYDGYEIVFPTPVLRTLLDVTPTSESEGPANDNHKDSNYIDPIHITIHTSRVDSPDEIIADVFKYVYTIKDRVVNISIM